MTHTPAPAFAHTSGPRDAKIMLVGEAWGAQEALTGLPFVGASGQELTRMLTEAGIKRTSCLLTNAFAFQPPSNQIDALCGSRAEVGQSPYPHVKQGRYIRPEYYGEFERLKAEIEEVRPNVIVPLGNTACIPILHSVRIGTIRGYVQDSKISPGLKALPTYHPAGVMRNWAHRVIAIADLLKVKREAEFPDIRRPDRTVIINPTLAEIAAWMLRPAAMYAVDIETGAKQIKCIGFARSRSDAIVVPFVDFKQQGGSYWPTANAELEAWYLVKTLLERPVPKLFQNGLYDLQYILRMGIRPANCIHDTMLLHHAMYPELQKGLEFLGSIYTDEAPWKLMRGGRNVELKKDE